MGERLTAEETPEPVSAAVCGLPGASSLTERVAVRDPVSDGVNVTLIVQLDPGATLPGQLLVWAKSLAFVPPIAIAVTFTVVLPVLENVKGCDGLVVPTAWAAKVVEDGVKLAPAPPAPYVA